MPARRRSSSQRRSNNNALGCFGLVALLFCAGIFGNHGSSITDTVSNPAPTARSLAYVVPTSTPIVPTSTALPPTATLGPGVGSTQTLDGWVISLARVEIWPQLPFTSKAGKITLLESSYWLVWVDARNTQKQAAALSTLHWYLRDADGNGLGPQGPEPKYGTLDAFVRKQGRDLFAASVKPTALTHPLLVFNPADSMQIAQLYVEGKQGGITFTFDPSTLTTLAAKATHTAVVVAAHAPPPPPTITPTRDLDAELAHIYATSTAIAREVATEVARSNAGNSGGSYSGARIGAICRDGSRSSATGRGACSHHGGVAQWIIGP